MKLYRLDSAHPIWLADDESHALEQLDDAFDDIEDLFQAAELEEPEATLHFNQAELSTLIALVARRDAVAMYPLASKLKVKLDGACWQLAAQKTMLEKAGEVTP